MSETDVGGGELVTTTESELNAFNFDSAAARAAAAADAAAAAGAARLKLEAAAASSAKRRRPTAGAKSPPAASAVPPPPITPPVVAVSPEAVLVGNVADETRAAVAAIFAAPPAVCAAEIAAQAAARDLAARGVTAPPLAIAAARRARVLSAGTPPRASDPPHRAEVAASEWAAGVRLNATAAFLEAARSLPPGATPAPSKAAAIAAAAARAAMPFPPLVPDPRRRSSAGRSLTAAGAGGEIAMAWTDAGGGCVLRRGGADGGVVAAVFDGGAAGWAVAEVRNLSSSPAALACSATPPPRRLAVLAASFISPAGPRRALPPALAPGMATRVTLTYSPPPPRAAEAEGGVVDGELRVRAAWGGGVAAPILFYFAAPPPAIMPPPDAIDVWEGAGGVSRGASEAVGLDGAVPAADAATSAGAGGTAAGGSLAPPPAPPPPPPIPALAPAGGAEAGGWSDVGAGVVARGLCFGACRVGTPPPRHRLDFTTSSPSSSSAPAGGRGRYWWECVAVDGGVGGGVADEEAAAAAVEFSPASGAVPAGGGGGVVVFNVGVAPTRRSSGGLSCVVALLCTSPPPPPSPPALSSCPPAVSSARAAAAEVLAAHSASELMTAALFPPSPGGDGGVLGRVAAAASAAAGGAARVCAAVVLTWTAAAAAVEVAPFRFVAAAPACVGAAQSWTAVVRNGGATPLAFHFDRCAAADSLDAAIAATPDPAAGGDGDGGGFELGDDGAEERAGWLAAVAAVGVERRGATVMCSPAHGVVPPGGAVEVEVGVTCRAAGRHHFRIPVELAWAGGGGAAPLEEAGVEVDVVAAPPAVVATPSVLDAGALAPTAGPTELRFTLTSAAPVACGFVAAPFLLSEAAGVAEARAAAAKGGAEADDAGPPDDEADDDAADSGADIVQLCPSSGRLLPGESVVVTAVFSPQAAARLAAPTVVAATSFVVTVAVFVRFGPRGAPAWRRVLLRAVLARPTVALKPNAVLFDAAVGGAQSRPVDVVVRSLAPLAASFAWGDPLGCDGVAVAVEPRSGTLPPQPGEVTCRLSVVWPRGGGSNGGSGGIAALECEDDRTVVLPLFLNGDAVPVAGLCVGAASVRDAGVELQMFRIAPPGPALPASPRGGRAGASQCEDLLADESPRSATTSTRPQVAWLPVPAASFVDVGVGAVSRFALVCNAAGLPPGSPLSLALAAAPAFAGEDAALMCAASVVDIAGGDAPLDAARMVAARPAAAVVVRGAPSTQVTTATLQLPAGVHASTSSLVSVAHFAATNPSPGTPSAAGTVGSTPAVPPFANSAALFFVELIALVPGLLSASFVLSGPHPCGSSTHTLRIRARGPAAAVAPVTAGVATATRAAAPRALLRLPKVGAGGEAVRRLAVVENSGPVPLTLRFRVVPAGRLVAVSCVPSVAVSANAAHTAAELATRAGVVAVTPRELTLPAFGRGTATVELVPPQPPLVADVEEDVVVVGDVVGGLPRLDLAHPIHIDATACAAAALLSWEVEGGGHGPVRWSAVPLAALAAAAMPRTARVVNVGAVAASFTLSVGPAPLVGDSPGGEDTPQQQQERMRFSLPAIPAGVVHHLAPGEALSVVVAAAAAPGAVTAATGPLLKGAGVVRAVCAAGGEFVLPLAVSAAVPCVVARPAVVRVVRGRSAGVVLTNTSSVAAAHFVADAAAPASVLTLAPRRGTIPPCGTVMLTLTATPPDMLGLPAAPPASHSIGVVVSVDGGVGATIDATIDAA